MVSSNNPINNKVGASISGVTNTFTVTNGSNTASSAANSVVSVGGATAADPQTTYTITGATSFAQGIDNSDSDKYKVSIGTALGTNDAFVITTAGAPTFPMVPLNVASGGTGDSSLTTYAVLCGGTTTTNPVQSVASVGTSGQVLTSNGAGMLPTFQAASSGGFVKQVRTTVTTVFTASTIIPQDATIPQNTEGTEVMSLSVTPSSINNILLIEVNVWGTTSQTGASAALFQDSNANAISAVLGELSNGSVSTFNSVLRYSMTAGTTSSTTFKVRVGQADVAGTWRLNSCNTVGNGFGGVGNSFMTITEYTS